VRKVCPVCGRSESPTEDEQIIFEKNGFADIKKVKRAVGCSSCNNKGYKGRVAVFEILDVNEKIARMISNHEKEYDILEQAKKDGTKLLVEAGLAKVKAGVTTVEEILKLGLD
jgi:type IV pilus assembly protein PilB